MRAIQEHYRGAERDPTDLELETLAQTWSEHCVHKTLKSAVVYRGAAMPVAEDTEARRNEGTEARRDEVAIARRVGEVVAEEGEVVVELRYGNLLRDTIARATRELIAAGRGPECLSVFRDNAGIIAFDERLGVAFKVETHNHPSAIEPYGGAATGVGGCIRDVIGCGLGARPIANTDVFCVAPGDWPIDALPHGVLHPARVLREVVRGVADYGNRMGIPTVNGAVHFDPRYLGNPLVYCGCVGLIPRERIEKGARPGDRIILLGGRTGRDGIHGATFSSAELTGGHADEFSHAVQIGNAITEKRILDAVLRARDAAGGCLYSAITDCGAGGLSSAVGEMGAEVGARVELGDVPLKYAGLRYDEIWISEAQERMVLAVPPQRLDALLAIAREEEVEATVIGDFGERDGQGRPRLVVCFAGQVVGELDMRFLHEGIPRRERQAEWRAVTPSAPSTTRPASRHAAGAANDALARLTDLLADPTIASKEWLIRRYDHEVQGGSVVKPLCGIGGGPSDAAVLRPRLDSNRGIAIGCGLAPHLSDVDPYWMAVDSIDEAIRNVVSVGGDPARIALLDNFCWGRTDDPRQMGALVRACQACCDAATAFGAPFISGKDSLNNHFALEPAETDRLAALISDATAARGWLRFGPPGAAERIAEQVRRSGRLSIPPTLLISAIALIDDVERCLTADLKRPGYEILLIGGFVLRDFSFAAAAAVHHAVAAMIRDGLISACHDVDLGGWLTALAEMAIAGDRGVEVIDAGSAVRLDPFDECAAGYLVESSQTAEVRRACAAAGVDVQPIARVRDERLFTCGAQQVPLEALRRSWQRLAQG
jgi:phosphoribosylformylglycinamidine synthase